MRRFHVAAALLAAIILSAAGCAKDDGPELRLYVAQFDMPFGDSRLFIISLPDLTIEQTLRTGQVSARLAPAPSGEELWICGEASKDIGLFDSRRDLLLGRIPMRLPVAAGAFDPAGRRFLATHGAVIAHEAAADSVTLLDVATRKIVGRLAVGASPRAACFGVDGRLAYVANTGDGTISVVDPEAMAVVDTRPTGQGPFHVAVDPLGRWLYVACIGAQRGAGRDVGTLLIHALPGLEIVDSLSAAGRHPSRVLPTPDGKRLVTCEMRAQTGESPRVRIFGIEAVGGAPRFNLRAELEAGINPISGDMSPDGHWVAAPDYDQRRVAFVDVRKEEVAAWIDLTGTAERNFSVDAAFGWHGGAGAEAP